MSKPVKCVCGETPHRTGCQMVTCFACGRTASMRSWDSDMRALKHHDLLTGFVEEVRAQTVYHANMIQARDMAALYNMAVAVKKEMEK